MMSVGQSVELLGRETDGLGENLAPVPLYPPQIPHDLTQAAAVGRQRLTVRARAWPSMFSLLSLLPEVAGNSSLRESLNSYQITLRHIPEGTILQICAVTHCSLK
jgi:hypothetical protein